MSGAKIIAFLALLAEQSGENVSPARIEFMARKLLPFDHERVCNALEGLLETARRFPTVAEIKSAMGVNDASDADKGREAAERIYAAICRFGSQMKLWDEIKAFIGPIGVEVVKMQGGWLQLCETTTNDNSPTLKAQWRELAEVLVRKNVAGDYNAPQFPSLSAGFRAQIKELETKSTPNYLRDKRDVL